MVDAYKILSEVNNQVGFWLWKVIWKVKIQLKVACFSWLVANEAVLTPEKLKLRDLTYVPDGICLRNKQRQSIISFYTANGHNRSGEFSLN